MTTTTTYMSLTLPDVGVTPGTAWATYLNAALTTVDAHDHGAAGGKQVTPAGLNLNADVNHNPSGTSTGNNIYGVRSLRLKDQAAVLTGGSDVACLFVKDGNLYYNYSAADHVRITSGAALDASSLVSNTWVRLAVSGSVVIGAGDTNVFYDVDTTAAGIAITLPTAAAASGKFYVFKHRTGANTFSIDRAGADTIDGATSLVVQPNYSSVILYAAGATNSWRVFMSSQSVNGAQVDTAAGALVTGNVLQVNGTSKLTYGPIHLNLGSNYVDGELPGGNMADAVAGTKGALRLAYDLGGTATQPEVVNLSGDASGFVSFRATKALPTIYQVAQSGGSPGNPLTIQAQNKGTGSSAGDLILQSGSDGAGETTAGAVQFKLGTRTSLKIQPSATATDVTMGTAAAGAGVTLQVHGQTAAVGGGGGISISGGNGSGTNYGGGVVISSGADNSGTDHFGNVFLSLGPAGTDMAIQLNQIAATQKVVGLVYPSALSTIQVPSGSGLVFIGNATTDPTNKPVGGCEIYSSAGVSGMFTINSGSGAAFGLSNYGALIGAAGASAGYISVYIDGNPYKMQIFSP